MPVDGHTAVGDKEAARPHLARIAGDALDAGIALDLDAGMGQSSHKFAELHDPARV